MNRFHINIDLLPQPKLPEPLQTQPPVAPAQKEPPVIPADDQLPALNHSPMSPPPDLNHPPVSPPHAQDQPPVAAPPAQEQPPVSPPPAQSHSTVAPPAQSQSSVAQPRLEAPPSETPALAKPVTHQYKNYLQEYTQKEGLPLPAYNTIFNGELHSPMFRATVLVKGVTYTSQNVFPNRKAAEMDVARVALLSVLEQKDDFSIGQEELILCKAILKEYADKIFAENPSYVTEKGDGSGFTSSVTFNGKQYVGDEGRNKKESQHLAARAVIQSILDTDARSVISKIIKSKKKMICKPAGMQTISSVGIMAAPSKNDEPVVGNNYMVKTDSQEPYTGNSSTVSAEPASLVELSASARLNLEQIRGGSTSSRKRKRKTKKAAGNVAKVQVAAVPSSQNTTSTVNNNDPICAPNSCVSLPGSDNSCVSLPGSDNAVLS